jgi:hypothetical protein
VSSSFATRSLPPRAPDGWPWRAAHRRPFLLMLAGAALAAVNVVVLRAAWALGSGAVAWEAHLAQLRSVPALALHAALCAIAGFCAWGMLSMAARVAGGEQKRSVLIGGSLAFGSAAALVLALCAGAFA